MSFNQFSLIPLMDLADANPSVSVGVASEIVAANNLRVGLWIQNMSANNVFIRPGRAPTTTQGLLVPPLGDFVEITFDKWGLFCGLQWQGIADGAAADLYILELKWKPRPLGA